MKLYKVIHKDRAGDLEDAKAQAIDYFASHGYATVSVLEAEVNPLGHYAMICESGVIIPKAEGTTRVYVPPSDVETLTCENCGGSFERNIVRGRKPRFCGNCLGAATKAATVEEAIVPIAPAENPVEAPTAPAKAVPTFTCTKCWNVVSMPKSSHKC